MVALQSQPTETPQPSEPSLSPKKISLPILSDITTAQAAHGLKHADYLRYRRYCTRRLSRIRTATKSSNRHPAHLRRYHPKDLTPAHIHEHPRALTIPLVMAERVWAYAMDVKREQPAGPARARRVVLSKLSRAVHFADQLCALCREVADEPTVLEAEAYSKSMQAALALEREAWPAALRAYEIAEKIYTGMAGVRAGTSAATLYERRLEEVAQGIRFCKYNLSREGDQDALLQDLRADATSGDMLGEKIESALVEARKRAAVSFGEVTWCGVVVPLRAERVREAVLMASEESKAFNSEDAAVDSYDKLFMVYNDAIKVVTDELAEFRATSTAADDRIKELEYLVAYLTFDRLQHTISRNLLLVESFKNKRASKPDDFVRLYDNLIANMTDVLALGGVEEDAAVSNEAESRRKLFQAYRCFHLAQCYQAAQLQSEAAALFDRVSVHAKSLSGKYAAEASNIVKESTGMKYRARAEAYLKEQDLANGMNGLAVSGNEVSFNKKSIMVDHLDDFESFTPTRETGRVICEMPPALEAVPCKPVFFDLAIDGIRFPERDLKPEPEPEAKPPVYEKEEQTPSAFSSTRLGRWWSGKS